MSKLIYASRDRRYEIDITHKITILTGYSATGKTQFINALNANGSSITCEYNLIPLPLNLGNNTVDSYLTSTGDENTLFYADEDVEYLRTKEFQVAVNNSTSLFLFIDREVFPSIPYGHESIYSFEGFSKHSIAKHRYDKYTDVNAIDYARLADIKVIPSSPRADKEIAQEITSSNHSDSIVNLASQFSNDFKAKHSYIDFVNPLSIQMHCSMLLELNQI